MSLFKRIVPHNLVVSNKVIMPEPTVLPRRRLSYETAYFQGIGAREGQEDSYALSNADDVRMIKNQGLLFTVCDGIGGMSKGKVASETTTASIQASFANMDINTDISSQLRDSVILASAKVEEVLGGTGGSTLIAGVIYDEKLYYASVGDSYLYLKRGSNLYRINKEHNMKNYVYLSSIRDGSMNHTEGRNIKEAAALTKFVGMKALDDIDYFVKPMCLEVGDVLLACSDGVGGVLEDGELFAAFEQPTAQGMCNYMDISVKNHNKKYQDNYTGIVVKCVK